MMLTLMKRLFRWSILGRNKRTWFRRKGARSQDGRQSLRDALEWV